MRNCWSPCFSVALRCLCAAWMGVLLAACIAPARAADLAAAQALFARGEFYAAAELAEQALDEGAWNETWRILKIRAELATGQYRDALATLEAALRRHSTSVRLRLVGRDVYRRNNRPEQADAMLDQIEALVTRSPWRYSDAANRVAVGRFLLLRGADARNVLELFYDKVKKEHPQFAEAFIAAGDLALDKQDYAVAAVEFERALKLAPDDANLHAKLARAYAPSDTRRANQALSKALKLNPRHVDSLLFRIDHQIDAEEYAEADSLIDQVLAVNAEHPEAWAYRAVLAHLAADPAAEQIARWMALCSWQTNPLVDHLIGRKLSGKYRFAEGAEYQRAALKLDGEYLPAKIQLSQDLLRLGEEEEGWRLAAEVNERDGYHVVAHNLVTLEETIARFRTLEADGFLVRMDAREARVYGPEVLNLLARAKEVLCAKYEVELNAPVVVEIFPQQKDFAIRTFGLPGGAGFLGVCFGRVITLNSPASQAENPTNWQSVLWHEFCHVVTLEKTRNKMPRWLSEGISVYEEKQRDPTWGQSISPRYRQMILGGELTPVSRLSGAFLQPKSPLHLQFAYYESCLVVEYLVEHYGIDTLRRVLVDLGVGMPINESLRRYTGSLEKLDADFAAYARQRAESLAPGVDWEPVEPKLQSDLASLADFTREHPKSFWGLLHYARRLVQEQQWKEAQAPLSRLIELYPGYIGPENAYQLLAQVHRELDQPEQERKVLEDLAALDADATGAYRRLMELYRAAEDWRGVGRNARRIIKVNPLDRLPQWNLARAAEALGGDRPAIRAYRAVLELDPLDPADTHYRLARLLMGVGETTAARREVLKALEEAPRFRAAHKLLLEIAASVPPDAQPNVADGAANNSPIVAEPK